MRLRVSLFDHKCKKEFYFVKRKNKNNYLVSVTAVILAVKNLWNST